MFKFLLLTSLLPLIRADVVYSTVFNTVTPTILEVQTVYDYGNGQYSTGGVSTKTSSLLTSSSASAAVAEKAFLKSTSTLAPTSSTIPSTSTIVHSNTVASSATAAAASGTSAASGTRGSKSGDGTFFLTGLGACGWTNSNDDLIVAIGKDMYDASRPAKEKPSSDCGKYINVYFEDKSVKVKVVDRCPGCAGNSLDLSYAAFDKIANRDLGRIEITWDWAS